MITSTVIVTQGSFLKQEQPCFLSTISQIASLGLLLFFFTSLSEKHICHQLPYSYC